MILPIPGGCLRRIGRRLAKRGYVPWAATRCHPQTIASITKRVWIPMATGLWFVPLTKGDSLRRVIAVPCAAALRRLIDLVASITTLL